MERRNTKRDILYAALGLFSVKGYEGVSVKEIASAIGIKDSSLYKHYGSKQEIFDSLLAEMDRHFGETVALYRIPQGESPALARQYAQGGIDFLLEVCRWNFLFFFKDPYASQYRRMLNIEQYHNPRAAEILQDFFMDTPLRFQESLFVEMMKIGFMKQGDPAVLAMAFYSPFWFLLDRYDGMYHKEREALERLEGHVRQFWNTYTPKEETL